MFVLTLNGKFELKYPNEFLTDLQELMEKHHAEYFGTVQTQNIGEYVDVQYQDEKLREDAKNE